MIGRGVLVLAFGAVACFFCCDDPEPEPACGDGNLDPGEECDDGNTVDGDGCSGVCETESATCPADMIPIPADPAHGVVSPFCIDRWEASRIDATETHPGTALGVATSRPDVLPWVSSPMGADVLATYQAACANAGKRLCRVEEWQSVCEGQEGRTYVYGDVFDVETCNCVDTFCDDYCESHPEIPDCPTGSGCGYATYSFRLQPTGWFPDCVSAHGAMDVCGNAWEIVLSDVAAGYEVRGGAYNCAGAEYRLQCTFNATWSDLWAGFRCCRNR